MDQEPHDEPALVQTTMDAAVEQKPDGSSVEMTPDAAVATAVRLLEAASKVGGDGKIAAEAKERQLR